MGATFNRKLPVPKEIKEKYPVPENVAKKKLENEETLKKIFTGEDKRFLAIIGPCSADNPEAVIDYVHRLAKVQEEIKDKVFIVPRIYTNKPRTTGKGYKGMLHQPDPEKESDLLNGLLSIRSLFVQIMDETGFPISDEMLYPENTRYFTDCLSYVAVGARLLIICGCRCSKCRRSTAQINCQRYGYSCRNEKSNKWRYKHNA